MVFPAPYTGLGGRRTAFPPPPTQRCDDVYRGVKIAEIDGPGRTPAAQGHRPGRRHRHDGRLPPLRPGGRRRRQPDRLDQDHDGRTQGVDHALLGVWDTATVRPGLYTLRLSLFDSVGNRYEGRAQYNVAPTETPTPTPSPTPAVTSTSTPGSRVTPTPPGPTTPTARPSQTAVPTTPASRTSTPTPARR